MTTVDGGALVRRFIQEVFEQGRTDRLGELVAEDFVSHGFHIAEDGRRTMEQAAARVHAQLRDVEFVVEDVLVDGDRVAVRLTASATPTGEFMGVTAAAGRRYTIGEMHWFRISDGLISEHWHQHDALGLLQQLGSDDAAQP